MSPSHSSSPKPAVMAVTGAAAQSKFSTLEEECADSRCTDPQYDRVIDDGKTLATVANVTLGVGIVGVLAGTAMIIFGGPSEPSTPSTHQAEGAWLRFGPSSATVGFEGVF